MRFLFPHILFTGFVILSFLCNSAAAQEEQKKLVWPPPPEKARIEYLYSFSSKPDIGIEKSIWRKVWDFIIGLQDEEEKIIQPAGVAVLDDRIFVSDPGASCVHIFNPKEKSYSQLTDSYTGRFGWPIGIAVSSTGNIYVADAARKEIAVFDRNEKPIHSIKGRFERPTGITIKQPGARLMPSFRRATSPSSSASARVPTAARRASSCASGVTASRRSRRRPSSWCSASSGWMMSR